MTVQLSHKTKGAELSQAEFEALDSHTVDSFAAGDLPTHGAGQHTDITRTLWLPADAWTIITGTPAITIYSARYRAWAFDSASDEEITTDFRLPDDWASGALVFKQYWTNAGAGAGDVVWRLDVAATAAAESLTAAWVTTRDTITAPAVSVLTVSTLTATVTPSASDLIQLLVGRDGDNAADTLGNDAGFLGLLIEYTGTQ